VRHQHQLLDDLFRHYDRRIRPYEDDDGDRDSNLLVPAVSGITPPPEKSRPILIQMTIVLGILIEMVESRYIL
jgi:hypothetical protein